MAPELQQYTAFMVGNLGFYEFTRMPFGLCNMCGCLRYLSFQDFSLEWTHMGAIPHFNNSIHLFLFRHIGSFYTFLLVFPLLRRVAITTVQGEQSPKALKSSPFHSL